MSSQNSIRVSLLFFVLVSFCQLGIAQSSETDLAYTAMHSVNQELTEGPVSIESEIPSTTANTKSAFDFSQKATLPSFGDLASYVAKHIQYPELAQVNSVEGKVVISLKLSSTGEVVGATVVESLGFGCDEAALALVTEMPNWNPASNYGVAVGAKQLVTIDFKL